MTTNNNDNNTTVSGNESTINRPEGARPLDAPVLLASLPDYARQIQGEIAWETNDRNAITLVHNEYVRVVLMALKDSAEITEHATDGNTLLQILSGRVRITTPGIGYANTIGEGELMAIKPGVAHSVFAETTAVVLLTMTPGAGGAF